MTRSVTNAEYGALAELRYRIRRFLQAGDEAARRSHLEPQQYLMLLAIRGLPPGTDATLRTLAGRMALKHHSAVELTDQLEAHGLVHRIRSGEDRREVRLSLSARGAKLLEQVARQRIEELRTSGATLADAIHVLVKRSGRTRKLTRKILSTNRIEGKSRS